MKDLHLHLSGATDPILLFEIINETGLKLKTRNYKNFKESLLMGKENVKGLEDYLNIIHTIDEAQSSPNAVERSFYKSYVDAYSLGCDYLELRWNPYKRCQNFKIDLDKLIVSARAGYEKARSIFGIEGLQIFILGRELDPNANEAIFKKAIKYFGKGVEGLDVAGPESKFPLRTEFEGYYKTANALGMITTMHAGEEYYDTVDETLATAIEKYKVQRIGHGIQIHRFPSLMKLASKAGIVFEICISSNLVTKVVKDEYEYAKILKIFEDNNLKYTICTDACYPLSTNIAKEHEKHEMIKQIAKKGLKKPNIK